MKRSTLGRLGLLSAFCLCTSASFAQQAAGTSLTEHASAIREQPAVTAPEPTAAQNNAPLPGKLQAPTFPVSGIGSLPPAVKSSGWGIGLRFGDPTGITVKKYLAGKKAFEFSIGRTHLWSGHTWYDDRFYDWYENEKFGYTDFQYVGYIASAPIGMQAHYLIHKDISKIGKERTSGLQWYYGFGAQLRFQKYRFDYRYKESGSNEWIYVRGDQVTDYDFGADGVVGLELKMKKAPVSLFTDATLFLELMDNPFVFWLQGGIGARYNF